MVLLSWCILRRPTLTIALILFLLLPFSLLCGWYMYTLYQLMWLQQLNCSSNMHDCPSFTIIKKVKVVKWFRYFKSQKDLISLPHSISLSLSFAVFVSFLSFSLSLSLSFFFRQCASALNLIAAFFYNWMQMSHSRHNAFSTVSSYAIHTV